MYTYIDSFAHKNRVVDTLVIPTMQMRKVRHGEVSKVTGLMFSKARI